MVVIRLARAGSVHRPFYRVVVTDSRARRDSNHIERIGYLNYYASGKDIPLKLDVERVEHWVSKGAIVRPSVKKLIKRLQRQSQESNGKESESQDKAATDNDVKPAIASEASQAEGEETKPQAKDAKKVTEPALGEKTEKDVAPEAKMEGEKEKGEETSESSALETDAEGEQEKPELGTNLEAAAETPHEGTDKAGKPASGDN